MMSWYILGYNNRKLSSVYTGRLGCDVIFLLFLSTPTPCLPRPCHWLPWYICFLRLKYYKVTTLKEEKGKWGRETERHILKGWFPSHHSHGAQPPPTPAGPPHTVTAAAQTEVRNSACWGMRGCASPSCRNEKETFPSLAQMSHRRDLPGKVLLLNFPVPHRHIWKYMA